MAVRPVTKMGNPILRQKARQLSAEEIVSPQIAELIADMQETMKAEGGIGIAAPQVGESIQAAIIELPADSERYGTLESSARFVIFNPVITIIDSTPQGFWEGCLSVPGLRGYVERARKVKIDYLDHEGIARTIEPEDFLATVFQHELDHLFGVLYIDRITDKSLLSYNEEFERFHT